MFLLTRSYASNNQAYVTVATNFLHSNEDIIYSTIKEPTDIPLFANNLKPISKERTFGIFTTNKNNNDGKGLWITGKENTKIIYKDKDSLKKCSFVLPEGTTFFIPNYDNIFWNVTGNYEFDNEQRYSEQEIFKYLCILQSMRNKDKVVNWKFFSVKILRPDSYNSIQAEMVSLFDDFYCIDSIEKLLCNMEVFANSITSLLPYENSDLAFDQILINNKNLKELEPQIKKWRQLLFKSLWRFLYDEKAVGEEMAEKINFTCSSITHLDAVYSLKNIREELKKMFGAAGEGTVVTIAKLLMGRQYTVKDTKQILSFKTTKSLLIKNEIPKIPRTKKVTKTRKPKEYKDIFLQLNKKITELKKHLELLEKSLQELNKTIEEEKTLSKK